MIIMNVFISDTLTKQLNNNVNRTEIITRLNHIVDKLLRYENINQLYEDASFGFKKYKGKKYEVYGIDLGLNQSSNMAGERLIVSFVDANEIAEFSRTIEGEKQVVSILLHLYCKHDDQNRKATLVNSEFIKSHDYLPLESICNEDEQKKIEDSINLKTKYQKYVDSDYNKPKVTVLTLDKYEIIDNFVYNTKPTILTGIAGSGKTEIIIKIMHDIITNMPQAKILYVTYSENLQHSVNEKCKTFKHNTIWFESLKSLIRKIKQNPNLEFETFETFKQFMNEYKINNNTNFELQSKILKFISKNNIYDVYSEIYGILMGSMLNEWSRKETEIINFKDYEELTEDYKIFEQHELDIMYKIAKLYLNYLNQNNITSYNKESMEILNNGCLEKYDYVLVDEVQDLTECQIKMLLSFLKDKNNILLCGDTNQIINPTFFKVGRIKRLFNLENINILEPVPLKFNFRNSKIVTDLINYVNSVRIKYLPKGKIETIQKEESKNTLIGNIYNFTGDRKDLYDYLQSSNIQMIVDEKDYKELEKQKEIDLTNVYTVQEAKGMEFENVILMNIIHNRNKVFEDLYLNGKSNNATLHYNFNLFYVGITRTIFNLVLVDDLESLLYKDILNNVQDIETVDTTEEINLKSDRSAKAFYNLAIQLIERGIYPKAINNLKRCKKAEKIEEIDLNEVDKLLDICNMYVTCSRDIILAPIFEEKGYYEYALKHYKAINDYQKIALIYLLKKEYLEFENIVKQNNINVLKLYNQKERYDKALDIYFDKKYEILNEEKEDISSFVKEANSMMKKIKFIK